MPRTRVPSAAYTALAIVVASAVCGCVTGNGRGIARADVRRAVLVSQQIVPVPSTIDYTGKTDVTASLQSFIDGLDDGVVVRFHPNGRYRVDGTLFVTNKTLTFDGQNATIFATTTGTLERSQWWITDGSGIVFRRMKVVGANPHAGLADNAYNAKYAKQHGFRIEGVDGIELDHVTVTDTYGDFVYVARFINDTPTNVWIHDSTFRRNGRQGISLVAATGVIIERNTFADTRRGTIDLEPNGPAQTVSDVYIMNNTIGRGRLMFIASHGKGPVNDIVITKNQLPKHLLAIEVMSPTGQRRKNWIVTNNTSDVVAHSRPIRFIGIDGVLVRGNKQSISTSAEGVKLQDVCGGTVKNNIFGKGPQVVRSGPNCSATLVTPPVPDIPGRS